MVPVLVNVLVNGLSIRCLAFVNVPVNVLMNDLSMRLCRAIVRKNIRFALFSSATSICDEIKLCNISS